VPLKPWTHSNGAAMRRMLNGTARLSVDTETGLLVYMATSEAIETKPSTFQLLARYTLRRVTYGAPLDAATFQLPAGGLREVKELSRWGAAKINKQLAGKPAPEFAITDIQGKPLTLAAFQGRTVLLDFWTTWCPPCRADAPALDKLYRKYGERELMIIGVSVGEDRAVVEHFLKTNPHGFPIVLSTENDMPPPYRISALPTYIVIDRTGAVFSAAEGDQGLGDLKKLLKKAGLELD
jgi:thiol-disulfide isomerase/thioredoxin